MVQPSTRTDLGPFELALRGDRRRAGDSLARLEWSTAEHHSWGWWMVGLPLQRGITRVAAAGWLLEAGDTTQALRLLAFHEAVNPLPFAEKIILRPLVSLQLARIEDARGRVDDARRLYQEFLIWYDMPPPAHLHLVEEARAALARLSGASQPSEGR